MCFFDQPYYAMAKAHMCLLGVWPDQSKNGKIIRLIASWAIALSIVAPRLTRFDEIWEDTDALLHDVPIFLTGAGVFCILLIVIQRFDKIILPFDNIERHWEMFENTSAVVVLHNYTERGRRISAVCSKAIYITTLLYWFLCLHPTILDVIHPLNETRSKIYILHTDCGVDKDKYYFFVLAHEYIVTMVGIVTVNTGIVVYVTWAVHACALFEVVCFAELVNSICSEVFATALFFLSIIIVFTGVQALIFSKNRSVLIQSASFILVQICLLYIINMPGQELINHSEKIRTIAYDLEWPDMPVKAQKLLMPIMIRSNKPCCYTATKVYILSMESFSSTIRTVMSYFTIFAQMI